MKIVVAVRCRNEDRHIERFLHSYDFADHIVISDGGSTDRSLEILNRYSHKNPKFDVRHFGVEETVNNVTWNPDAPHMNFVIAAAREYDPDWLIFDDMDDVPNYLLRKDARVLLSQSPYPQVNAFRLYLWGDDQHFPYMNRNFDMNYTSLWAWKPKEIDIHADESIRHGTMVGTATEYTRLNVPYCLLHRSWYPNTITAKMIRYNLVGLPMDHPLQFAGPPEPLPEFAHD